MSEFGKALKEKDDFYPEDYPFIEKYVDYYSKFVNQYIKIPDSISDKVGLMYGSKKLPVKHCIKLLITNLLAQGMIAYSKDTHFYTKHCTEYYTYAHFLCAVNILVKDKYALETHKGSKNKAFESGISSRLNPRDEINQEFALEKIEYKIDLKSLPLLVIDKKPIFSVEELNSVKVQHSINTINIHIHSHSNTQHSNLSLSTPYHTFFRDSELLNRNYFNNMELDFSRLNLPKKYLDCVGLTKIFNAGECGRWFQKGGYSYQQLSEEERGQILLNGYEVAELDYSAMHPNILYAWEKTQAPRDLYGGVLNLLNLNREDKFVVKKTILLSINADSYRSLSSAINFDKKEEGQANETRRKEGRPEKLILYDEQKRLDLKPDVIVNAFTEVHPVIAKYVYSASANKLMLEESEIMTLVLLELMKQGIPALPVHDSLLFPKQHKDGVRQNMLDFYEKHTGFEITVK